MTISLEYYLYFWITAFSIKSFWLLIALRSRHGKMRLPLKIWCWKPDDWQEHIVCQPQLMPRIAESSEQVLDENPAADDVQVCSCVGKT
jgi:hypothetical protein